MKFKRLDNIQHVRFYNDGTIGLVVKRGKDLLAFPVRFGDKQKLDTAPSTITKFLIEDLKKEGIKFTSVEENK